MKAFTITNEYKCEACCEIFIEGWTKEEAEQEAVKNFGAMVSNPDECGIVCDDCYNKIMVQISNQN